MSKKYNAYKVSIDDSSDEEDELGTYKMYKSRLNLTDTINYLSYCQMGFDCQISIQDTRSHYSSQEQVFYYQGKFA